MTQNLIDQKNAALDHLRMANTLFIKLCQPLHEIGIRHYYFIKCHEDGTYLAYGSNREVIEGHIQNIHSHSPFFKDSVDITPNSQILFSLTGDIHQFDLKADPVISLFWNYGWWNTFMLYKIMNNNLLEGWGFSLGPDFRDPVGFFLKNKPLLERFVHYFEIVGKELIDTSNKRKLAVYDGHFAFFNRSSDVKMNEKLLHFLHQTHLNKLSVHHEGQPIDFTQRQGECLYYLVQHHTVKEIAQLLDLSPRSVETYIQTVKDKISVSSKSDLLKFIHQHELSQKLQLLNRISN